MRRDARPNPVRQALADAVARGVTPGAAVAAMVGDELVIEETVGWAQRAPRPARLGRDTRFDLASLTKPLVTATAAALLMQEGRLTLEAPVEKWLPEFTAGAGRVRVEHLLTHASGLAAWRPLYRGLRRSGRTVSALRRAALARVHRQRLTYEPGSRSLYSDLGFILLGEIIERVSGMRLDRFARARICAPLGLHRTAFRPIAAAASRPSTGARRAPFAATERCRLRRRILVGEVHDRNAFVLGGVAGHAGLFGTAAEVARLGSVWLAAVAGATEFLDPALARRFVARTARVPGSSWALGWDTPTAPSASGSRFSARAFGHLGFTGTSLWCDPERRLAVAVLTNRVHPTSRNLKIRAFRPLIHDVIVDELRARARC